MFLILRKESGYFFFFGLREFQPMVFALDNKLIFFIFFYFFPIYKFDCYLDFFFNLIIDIPFSFLTSFNSDEAVSAMGLKALFLNAFYGLLSRFGFLFLSLYSFVFHFF